MSLSWKSIPIEFKCNAEILFTSGPSALSARVNKKTFAKPLCQLTHQLPVLEHIYLSEPRKIVEPVRLVRHIHTRSCMATYAREGLTPAVSEVVHTSQLATLPQRPPRFNPLFLLTLRRSVSSFTMVPPASSFSIYIPLRLLLFLISFFRSLFGFLSLSLFKYQVCIFIISFQRRHSFSRYYAYKLANVVPRIRLQEGLHIHSTLRDRLRLRRSLSHLSLSLSTLPTSSSIVPP